MNKLADTIKALGFIGLGVMGEHMCSNLAKKSGLPVYAQDLNSEPIERLVEQGVNACDSVADVAANADIIFLSLPSGVQVDQVCFGPNGIIASAGRARVIVDMGTSSAELTRTMAARCAKHGIVFIDAPVARTREAARTGNLCIMVGATDAAFEMIKPLLSCMGTDIILCGTTGNGQVVKILNNMVLFLTVHALAEALAIGRQAGVDGALLFDVMSKGSADSFALRTPGLKALVPGNFPTDAFPTDYAIKDILLALELADQGGVDAQAAKLTRKVLGETTAAGYGRNYYPAMIKRIEPQP
jgi:3-hydroxyisobutyrate dehydrogenase-like beta-hydroxyacid dehydrogenase